MAEQWLTLVTAPDQLTAELWCQLLRDQGVPAVIAPADAVRFMGLSMAPCRLLVPAKLKEAAEQALRGELWSSPV